MKEIDDTPKDALTDGIADAVRDIAKKREAMAGWDKEYSRKRGRDWAMVGLLASAACVALMLFIGIWDFGRSDEPVLRGGLSYDAVLERIDSLINTGNIPKAKETILQVREEIAADTLKRFYGADPEMEAALTEDEIEYERIILKDVLSRLDELEDKTLKTNE